MGDILNKVKMKLTSFATLAVASAWDFGSYSSPMSFGMSHSWQSPMWSSGHHMWSDNYNNYWNGEHFDGMQMWNNPMWNNQKWSMNNMMSHNYDHHWFGNNYNHFDSHWWPMSMNYDYHMNMMPYNFGSHYWFNNWNSDMHNMQHFNFMSPKYGNHFSSKWSYSPSYYRRHNWFNRSWNNNNFRYYWF